MPDVLASGPYLVSVKTVANGRTIVQNEFQYSIDGRIKTGIGYKDYTKNLVSYKRTYNYEDRNLLSSEMQIDIASSLSTVNYVYSKTQYEYSSDLIIQSNHFSKKNDQYELTSFSTYTYNNKKLPARVSRYTAGGSLYNYSTYIYDENGNVTLWEEYQIDDTGNPVKNFQRTYQYDDKRNPYKNAYQLLENIPYSVNQNNIISSTWTNYTVNSSGNPNVSTTKYNGYNSAGYPVSMSEQDNIFEFEYK